ncbi:MAG: hypothetical protein AAF226_13510 [Verrucomicrobiota bacterium]
MPEEITRTAYHECGHALMACISGAQVDYITIEPEDGDGPERYGETKVRWPETGIPDKQIARSEIKIALAGPVVEMIFDEVQNAPEFLAEWAGDWATALDRADFCLPPDKPISQQLAQIGADLVIFFEREDVWAAVAAMADGLEAHGTLETYEIGEILAGWPIAL